MVVEGGAALERLPAGGDRYTLCRLLVPDHLPRDERRFEDPNTTSLGFTKNFPTDPTSVNTFTLQDDGVKDYGQTVLPGTGYTVNEDVIPARWDLVDIDCDVAGRPSVGVTPRSTRRLAP